MGFMFNGLSAEVTISGGVTTDPAIPTPSSDQTPKEFAGTFKNATTTLYTVPAGKIVYITDVKYGIATGTGHSANPKLLRTGALLFDTRLSFDGSGDFIGLTFATPLKYVATETIQIQETDNDATLSYLVTGVEVDA